MISVDDLTKAIGMQLATNNLVWAQHVPIVKSDEEDTYVVYLTDDVVSVDVYNELISLFLTSHSRTSIHLVISTYGGDANSAAALYDAIKYSSAHVTSEVLGTVASAGTIIALACEHVSFRDSSIFMIHESSFSNLQGKSSDIHKAQEFNRKWLEEFFGNVYGGFLSNEELEQVLTGTELRFTASEATERFNNKGN